VVENIADLIDGYCRFVNNSDQSLIVRAVSRHLETEIKIFLQVHARLIGGLYSVTPTASFRLFVCFYILRHPAAFTVFVTNVA